MTTHRINVSAPIEPLLDEAGFLSRECPACKRQFRVHNEGTPSQTRYFCPYCAQPARSEAWWTREQARFHQDAGRKLMEELLVKPMRECFKDLARKSGGTITYRPGAGASAPTPSLPPHANAPRLVKPPCHPTAELRVREDVPGTIHCFACGVAV